MVDHIQTAFQALRYLTSYIKPSSYRVTHRMNDVNDIMGVEKNYHLILLDRDCSLHGYHATKRDLKFEETLQSITKKSEIVSNLSYEEFLRIRDVFGELLSMCKLVRFVDFDNPHLLRFDDGDLKVYPYNPEERMFEDVTHDLNKGDKLLQDIVYNYKKPNPIVLQAAIDYNRYIGTIPKDNPRVLMIGDRYLTDIIAGNLAGVDTAKVWPVEPWSEKWILIMSRWLMDAPIGFVMSRLNIF